MIESLEDLSKAIRDKGGHLMLMYGDHLQCVKQFAEAVDVSAIYYNKDYSPYAVERDKKISDYCKSKDLKCIEAADYYLHEPGTIKTSGNKVYQKYTPFYEACHKKRVPSSVSISARQYSKLKAGGEEGVPSTKKITLSQASNKFVSRGFECGEDCPLGGRDEGVHVLRSALTRLGDYSKDRDFLTYKTSGLSPYIRFGCVSIREVYHAFEKKHGGGSGFIKELLWRDFFAHVLYGFPQVLGAKGFVEDYKSIRWRSSTSDFEKWKIGKTGFPIVDACMRELNAAGYMHNRGRMIVATFLVKTLLLNWKWGEKYFAQKLRDYDVASNNGNWQSISSTGVDRKPYFRDMNPWIQSAKFDPDAEYIKKWVPELKEVDARDIHKWYQMYNNEKYKEVKYSSPMVSYEEQKEKMLKLYRSK
jgi:deoxyribodipyrimidine photo-lyase